ncbi:2946_t:CDS:1, partial [Paraglomus occultum]
FLRDGTVLKRLNDKWKRVILQGETEEIIREIHEAGHLGMQATIKKIQERYWWPGLVGEVQKFVSTCDQCQREKKPEKAKDIYPIVATRPFQIVGIDHVGPLHLTKKGNLYLIVAQDYFTKWPIAQPTQTTNTDEALEFVHNHIMTVYGAPEQIISDKGTAFTSAQWKRAMKKWGIKHTPTTAANPQANGQVERFNQTLIRMIKKKLGTDKSKWDGTLLQDVLMAYRSSVQATTQHTPSDLLFGYRMRLPIEGRYPIPIEEIEGEIESRMDQLKELQPERIKAAALIEEKQKRVKEKMEAGRDLANPYQVGDLVLLHAPAHKRKLEQANEGPFRIKEVGQRRTYVLETMGGVEYMKVSGRRLVPYKDRNQARVIVGESSHPLV